MPKVVEKSRTFMRITKSRGQHHEKNTVQLSRFLGMVNRRLQG